ncbi:aldehyde dehydrogenase family protein [Paraburkholderia dipogonis]|uniref:aldehyde dehydrogenase family protein n=1 Tax=Paraburkholderia dipogonis TaxID=1211383 RepID=UPI0035EB5F4C
MMEVNTEIQRMQLNNPTRFRSDAFIAGEWRAANEKGVISVTNPATRGDGVAPRRDGKTQEAVAAAGKAACEWRRTSAKARSGILRRWYGLTLEKADDLAMSMTAEQGKTAERGARRGALRSRIPGVVRGGSETY